MTIRTRERLRTGLMWLMVAIYLTAGVIHLAHPGPFLGITPRWVPFAPAVIAITGLCEIAGAIALLIPRLRRPAGLMLALYALCVWPANMQHAINDLSTGHGLGLGYHAPRLLFQPVIIWWALFAGRVIDWPLRARDGISAASRR